MSLSGLVDRIGEEIVFHTELKGTGMTGKRYRGIVTLMTAVVALTMTCAPSVQAARQSETRAYLTPETAGPDFKVQGEYFFKAFNLAAE